VIVRFRILVACAVLLGTTLAQAATIDVDILKVQNDRVYFDAGTESYIFGEHRFTLLCHEDTFATGTIARSFDGLSFGRADYFSDTVQLESCIGRVEVASIDSTGTIVIGLVESSPLNHWQIVSCERTDSITDNLDVIDSGRTIVARRFESQLAMVLAYESGEVDAMVGPDRPTPRGRTAEVVPLPAPYFFALLPNPESHANNDALLTTSLYYRFDQSRLTYLYDQAPALPFDRLCLGNIGRVRPYEYNPAVGRTLLSRMTPPIRRAAISYEYESLRPVAVFFGDLLSRDRVRITLGEELSDPDVSITAIPLYADRPWMSMEVIGHILAQDTVDNSRESELVRQLFERLQLARRFAGEDQGGAYLRRAEQGLIDDLGVFALFRPTVYLATSQRIAGVEITDEGRVDFCRAVRLVPPNHTENTGDAP